MAVTYKKSPDQTPAQAAKPSKKASKKTSEPTFIARVIKGDTYMVMAQSATEPEDEFVSLYFSVGSPNNAFIEPPFNPKVLKNLSSQNNILAQCVEAMEVNVDGTGHEFTGLTDKDKPDAGEEKKLQAFFEQPCPGKSFVTIRRQLRRELEQTGWAFLEGLSNAAGELVGLRNIVGHTIRLAKVGPAVQVTKTLMRDGSPVDLTMWVRERAYGQILASNQTVYYREWGSSRELNRETGEWESDTNKVPPDKRASELLMFKIHDDVDTAYGLPRWINQIPSVVGSRKAEEDNLSLMDSGGVPPAIIFVQGGTIAKETGDQLRMYLSGQLKHKNRAVVVDAQPTSGTLDSVGKVDVKVERFGSESMKDSMFEKYDTRTEEHVRTGFRLPPLFIGKAADYSYASASTSYMVAEAQVFLPERMKFDEAMNLHVVSRLKCTKTKFKSKPITLKDVTSMLEGLSLAKDKVEGGEWVGEVNKAVGLSLTFDKATAQAAIDAKASAAAQGFDPKVPKAKEPKVPDPAQAAKNKAKKDGEDSPPEPS